MSFQIYQLLLYFGIGYILTYLFQGLVWNMLISAGKVTNNYVGQPLPVSMGISFMISSISAAAILAPFGYFSTELLNVLFACIVIGLIGVVDDLGGNGNSKGFKE